MHPLADQMQVLNHSNNKSSEDPISEHSDFLDASPLHEDWMGQFWDCNQAKEILPEYLDEMSDDEVSHASSSHYFDQEDFVGWQSSYIPPMSFAVLLGGLAVVTHPFFWVAGALTAFGTAKACMSSDGLCGEGLLSPLSEEAALIGESEQLRAKELMSSHVSDIPYDAEESPKKKLLAIEHVPGKLEEEQPRQQEQQPSQESSDESRRDPSNLETTDEALNWVNRHYPPLAESAKENVILTGLNALEFFNVFFANEAPFTFEELQRKRQDKDIQYGKWETLEKPRQASLHPEACEIHDLSIQERLLNFKTKTNSFFGPPYADATKLQRVLVASKKLLVLEATTILKEVPFCDRFYITERWVVTAEKTGQVYHSSLSICYEVVFTQSCPFESQIVSSSKKTFLEIADTWIKMARQALKLTEEARTKRLELGKSASTTGLMVLARDPAIEVQHTGKLESSVIDDLAIYDEAIGDIPKPLKPKRMIAFRRNISMFGNFPKMLSRKRPTRSPSPSTTSASSSFSA